MGVEEIIDVDEFKLNLSYAKKYFRINLLKTTLSDFKSFTNIHYSDTQIDFVKALESHIQLGSTLEYFLGLIHPQSFSSSLVPIALSPRENDVVLDITASPGSKTTQISMHMNNNGIVVANDRRDRVKPLLHNIARLGVLNTIVITRDAKHVIKENYFDKAMVDVPCSALGSHLNAWKRFEDGIAKSLSRVQKRIILSAFDSLKEGGELVYSTCTITAEENEGVLSFLLENRDARLLPISLPVPHAKGLSDYGSEFKKAIRVYPKHIRSEGFFIAKVKKL